MDIFTRDDLNMLINMRSYPSVSIFMPTVIKGQEVKKNAIFFKDLLERAAEGSGKGKSSGLFDEAWVLQKNPLFWSHQDKGLAVFFSSGFFRYWRLPLTFKKQSVVTDKFHIKPLLEVFMERGLFYVLAFSSNNVRFFQGSRFALDEIKIDGMPEGIQDALRFDVPEKHVEFHTRSSSAKAGCRRPAVFHGQGAAADKKEHKKNLRNYFKRIDKTVRSFLGDSNAPLVLAGVQYLVHIYKDANSYHYLAEEAIYGSPDYVKPSRLHDEAWEIVEPRLKEKKERDLKRFITLSGKKNNLAGSGHNTIVPKAFDGKVETLFVAVGRHEWGRYDPEHNAFRIDKPKKKDSEDLLELAAVETIRHRGRVYPLEKEQIPVRGDIAAIFRK
jgi:hypothetical protein